MSDAEMMMLAIAEARRGRPSPNPHVGAVIATSAFAVLGRGHHERAGEAHAEVAAIRDASATEGHTIYVTMEPCNHHGRTPPCTEAILNAGLTRVVLGARDPAPHVPGSVERMRAAGIEVTLGVHEAVCDGLIADFAKHIRTGKPYVTLKAAVTLDGRMATRTGDSKWITSESARAEAHRMRDRSDAILVGVGTVLADDPRLTVRHVEGVDPLRVVLDATLRTPVDAQVSTKGTLIFHGPAASGKKAERLQAAGVELSQVPLEKGRLALEPILSALGARNVVRLLVEGGATLHGALLDGGFADHAAIFVAPKIIGDRDALAFGAGRGVDTIAAGWKIEEPRTELFGPDILIEGPLSSSS